MDATLDARTGRLRRALGLVVSAATLAAVGCASPDVPEDFANPDPDEDAALAQTVSATPSCASSDQALFFHGLQGYGREIRTSGLCAPSITAFSGPVASTSAPAATVVGGYSAGRIPLLLRMQKGKAKEKTAIMLDGSWADGRRYSGKTGPEIVSDWLSEDPERKFVLVYLESSAGWREYEALTSGPVASQITTCAVGGMSHFDLPRFVSADLFLDPDTWLADRCPTGRATR